MFKVPKLLHANRPFRHYKFIHVYKFFMYNVLKVMTRTSLQTINSICNKNELMWAHRRMFRWQQGNVHVLNKAWNWCLASGYQLALLKCLAKCCSVEKAIIILFDELLNYFCRHIFVFKASSRRYSSWIYNPIHHYNNEISVLRLSGRFKFKAWHQDNGRISSRWSFKDKNMTAKII
jgi:hypothetical protein